MSGMQFAKGMLLLYGLPWMGLTLLFAIGFLLAAAFIDLRWGIVFLMVVFIIAPLILFFFYIYHGFKRVTAINCVDHRVDFLKDKLVLTTLRKSTEGEEDTCEEISCLWIPYPEFRQIQVVSGGVCLGIDGRDEGFLWLPETAFSDVGSMKLAVDMIYGRSNR